MDNYFFGFISLPIDESRRDGTSQEMTESFLTGLPVLLILLLQEKQTAKDINRKRYFFINTIMNE